MPRAFARTKRIWILRFSGAALQRWNLSFDGAVTLDGTYPDPPLTSRYGGTRAFEAGGAVVCFADSTEVVFEDQISRAELGGKEADLVYSEATDPRVKIHISSLVTGPEAMSRSIPCREFSVEDDGRGIPVERTVRGVPAIETILTQLHCGATYDGHWPHVHVGPSGFGVGLAVVNALSEELEIEVRRGGYVWFQRYARGKPLGPLERGPRTERTGTRLRFRADPAIFSAPQFDRRVIRERLEELALWNPALTFELMAERIHESGGTARWIDKLAIDNGSVEFGEVFTTRTVRDGVFVEVALAWCNDSEWELRSFVGQSRTFEGGSHEKGFWSGLASAVLAQQRNAETAHGRPRRVRRRLAPGLLAVVHVALCNPEFAGPTRACLDSPEAERAVHRQLAEAFGAHLAERPELARSLLERLVS